MIDGITDVGPEPQPAGCKRTQLVLHFLLDRHPVCSKADGGPNEAPMDNGGIPSFKGTMDLGAVEPGEVAEAFCRTNIIAIKIKKGDRDTNFVWYFVRP